MEATPIDIVQKQRARIIAVMNYEVEEAEKMHKKQEDMEREVERQRRMNGRR